MANNEPAEQVPFADAPCDVTSCVREWDDRVEFFDPKGNLEVRFMCRKHSRSFLKELS